LRSSDTTLLAIGRGISLWSCCTPVVTIRSIPSSVKDQVVAEANTR
jgi:hypothetical protein